VLRRPLCELALSLISLEVPRLELVALAVKTCMLAIVRFHLYDLNTTIVATDVGMTHNLSGTLAQGLVPAKILKCAVAFVPSGNIEATYENAQVYRENADIFNTNEFSLFINE
jgi:hypothetical protein